jgi:hypothetical protein
MRISPGPLLAALLSALVLAACGGASTSSTSSASTSSSAASATSPASSSATTSGGTPGRLSYEGIPLEQGPALAPASTTQTGPVHGIQCAPVEQLAYHIHAHLAVFVNGTQYALPAGIGIPGSAVEQTTEGPIAAGGRCFYWLHTHTSDGVIHIESPTARIYTLGEFFDEWHQPLSTDRVGDVHGRITAFVNGKLWKTSLRAIPLLPHALIQLNIGEPAAPLMKISWSQTGL